MTEIPLTPEFELGPCARCPNAQHILNQIQRASKLANEAAEAALDMPFDEVSEMIFGTIEPLLERGDIPPVHPSGIAIDSPEAVEKAIRDMSLSMIGAQDEHVDELKTELTDLLAGCKEGPLKMRATKAGRTVTATVCVSSALPTGQYPEEVFIRRTTDRKTDGTY